MHDDQPISRRDAMMLLGFGAAAIGLPRRSEADVAGAAPPTRAAAFSLRDVRLLDGPFRDAQQRNGQYLLTLEPDRLLHNFLKNAGLTPKAPVYRGWESEEPWVDIRCHGHTLGHYLSASAMMYASTDDRRFAERAAYVVSELRRCQRAAGDGLVCAFPEGGTVLIDAIAGRPFAGVPWYTMHKIFAGLRDAHVHAASPDALAVLRKLTEWTWRATSDASDDQLQRMLDREHGGMMEVLADVAVLTEEPKYLDLARRFAHYKVLTPLAEQRDVLDGLHSNTQIPKFIGAQRVHELANEATYGEAARFFWETVTTRRSYVTGGNSDNEHFFPVTEFGKRIGSAKSMETCCTHNMLRLTSALYGAEPRASLMDYYERALYNGILASQDPDSGLMTYFQATRPGYVRLYHTADESFWCCTGSGIENHAKYGDSIYFHDADSLYVNLFIPSTVTWRERSLTLTQTTRFPEVGATRLAITTERPTRATLRVRKPAWCDQVTVAHNGRTLRVAPDAAGYLAITREWRSGDVVEVTLPMTLHVESLPGEPHIVAFLYGPIVLAGRLGTQAMTPAEQIIKNERTSGNMLNLPLEIPALVGDPHDLVKHVRPIPGASLEFETVSLGAPRDVRLAPYHRLAHERYVLYWHVRPS